MNTIEWEGTPSFNLWHDIKLLDFLQTEHNVIADEGGIMTVPLEALEAVMAAPEERLGDFTDEHEYRLQSIKADVEWAKKNREDSVQYMTY